MMPMKKKAFMATMAIITLISVLTVLTTAILPVLATGDFWYTKASPLIEKANISHAVVLST